MTTIPFKSKLFKAGSTAFLELPKRASAKLKLKNESMVEGIINFFPFRAPLDPEGKLKLSKAIVDAAKIQEDEEAKDIAQVEITRVGEESEVRLPKDFQKALTANARAKELWKTVTPIARRDWILSICVVKQTKTRAGRIVKTVDMLAGGKGRICCFPGINWMTRNYVKPEETWQKLKSRSDKK